MTGNLGPRLAAKPLHMFWLLDVSGSMSVNGKIEALNDAMREAVDAVRGTAAENPGTQVKARVITFAHDADWHIADPTDIEELTWSDIAVVEGGTTELGRAVDLVTEAIKEVASAGRGLPPAIILVSDGKPTDLKRPSYGSALRALDSEPWGRKASRIAIGIGQDADMNALHRFIGHDELPPIRAESAGQLTHYLRWASTVVVDDRSRPAFSWDDEGTPTETSHVGGESTPVTSVSPTTDASTTGQPVATPTDPHASGSSKDESMVDDDQGIGIGVADDIDDETPTVVAHTEVDDQPTIPVGDSTTDEQSAVGTADDATQPQGDRRVDVPPPLGTSPVAGVPESMTVGEAPTELDDAAPPAAAYAPPLSSGPIEDDHTVASDAGEESSEQSSEDARTLLPPDDSTVVADPGPVGDLDEADDPMTPPSSAPPQPQGAPRADLPPPVAPAPSPSGTNIAQEDASTVLSEPEAVVSAEDAPTVLAGPGYDTPIEEAPTVLAEGTESDSGEPEAADEAETVLADVPLEVPEPGPAPLPPPKPQGPARDLPPPPGAVPPPPPPEDGEERF